jgi:RNA polymerase sigma-70 factor, ECF subfamily
MRNPEDAADALQDAYIAAFRKAGSYRGAAQVTTWLHRVVVNGCLDRLRAMRLRETEHCRRTLIGGAGWARH